MDKGCHVVGCDELPVVEASVIVSRVTDVANIALQHNQFSGMQQKHNQLKCNMCLDKETTSARKYHYVVRTTHEHETFSSEKNHIVA